MILQIFQLEKYRVFYDLGVYFTSKPWNVVGTLWAIVHRLSDMLSSIPGVRMALC